MHMPMLQVVGVQGYLSLSSLRDYQDCCLSNHGFAPVDSGFHAFGTVIPHIQSLTVQRLTTTFWQSY